MTREVVLATGNAGKVRELQQILAPLGIVLLAQTALGVAPAEETGLSFIENAILKARHAARATGRPAIADDSGIAVDALGGAPGIYSARYAGPDASDAANVAKLLAAMADVDGAARRCRFICCMAYVAHGEDPVPIVCEGVWEGMLARAPRGSGGFGYDPVFLVEGGERTSAELDPETKNLLSHRGQAARALAARLAVLPRHA
jgi:XTP/dITP diphosphohydrolase